LYARRKLQHYHVETGRYLEAAFERASVSGVKVMDFTREPVGGSTRYSDPFSDAKKSAGNFIAHAKRTLGADFKLVELLLRERYTIEQVAGAMQCDSKGVIVRLREALEKLAMATGNATQGPKFRTPKDRHSKAAANLFKRAA
jgi:hypothetical protein